jgi:histidinol dehydrogenase
MLQAIDVETWTAARRTNLEDAKRSAAEIIERVRREGDAALLEMARKYEPDCDSIRVAREEIEAAYEQVDERLVEAVIEAEARIARFHERQKERDLWLEEAEPGILLGVKTTPIDRAGLYVPGRRAAYPSTALMNAVPAKVAGVASLCACSPPPILPLTLVACDIVGVDEVYRIGGAQAVAAMALGTETVRPCRKIVGPGNAYVTAAKMLLREHAEIDFPAGPSEIGIIADRSANPAFIAADILAQAEHDPDAACILIATDAALVGRVEEEIGRQLAGAPRKEIMVRALANSGYVTAPDLDAAVSAMDRVAPEHLSIMVEDPLGVLGAVRNAGSIFVGPYAPVAAGDYASGTNHVLPTAGYAATYSGLNVAHFTKTSTVQIISRAGLAAIGDTVETIASAEGLHAHANSVRVRRAWRAG